MDNNKLIHDTIPTLAIVCILASLFTTITTAAWAAFAAMLFIVPVQIAINKSLLKLPSEYNQAVQHLIDDEKKRTPTTQEVILGLLAFGTLIFPLPIAYLIADLGIGESITVNAIYGAATGFVAFKLMLTQLIKAIMF